METKLKNVTVFVAWDGSEFFSEEECAKYEAVTVDAKRTERFRGILAEAEEEYFKHKRVKWGFWDKSGEKYTGNAGKRHAQALKDYRFLLRRGQKVRQSRVEWLAEVGEKAAAVLEWREKEIAAKKRLGIVRDMIKEYGAKVKAAEEGTYKPTFGDFLAENGFEPVKQRKG